MKFSRKIILSVVIILFFFITGCISTGVNLFTVEVMGEVREGSVLNQSLQNVKIMDDTGEILGFTNKAGKFKVKTTPVEGRVRLYFEHPDYETELLEFPIDGQYNQVVGVSILTLKPAGEKISGRIFREVVVSGMAIQNTVSPSLNITSEEKQLWALEREYNLAVDHSREWLESILQDKGEIMYESDDGFYAIRLYPGIDEEGFIDNLENLEGVRFITPNYAVQALGVGAEPAIETDLWNLKMLNIEPAWKYSTGKGVVIAVIDTLYRTDHPDLVSNLLEPIDVTGEGDTEVSDDLNAHGLHVAGIIGAALNDSGVAGVAPEVSILPIRVFNSNGLASISNVIRGIDKAIEAGVDVINMSIGAYDALNPENNFPDLYAAIKKAYEAGIVLVAAAGNNGTDYLLYPAAYPEVIAVGAVNIKGERTYYSQYGEGIELMAPGGDGYSGIVSTGWTRVDGNTYLPMSGTSMAAPHVSGVAALLISCGITGPEYIRQILRESAVDLGDEGYDFEYGHGLIDPFTLLHRFGHSYVFFGEIERGYVEVKSKVFNVEVDGEYEISGVRPGIGRVIGWVDMNNNLVIDSGDYLGKSLELEVTPGMGLINEIDIGLTKVAEAFETLDIGEVLKK